MSDLEVTRVGTTIDEQFLKDLSQSINLPAEVCGTLLKSGWTLEVKLNAPARWVQPYPNWAVKR